MTHPTSSAHTDPESESAFLLEAYTRLRRVITERTTTADSDSEPSIIPSSSALATCLSSLPSPSSPSYLHPLGPSQTHAHLLTTILPALNLQSLSPRYLAFVTGGVLPIAEAADNLVTAIDQNVQVHFHFTPEAPWQAHSASTAVEDAALRMLISLLELDDNTTTNHDEGATASKTCAWPGRTFTTGATASNILGLACARDAVVNRRLASLPPSSLSSSSPTTPNEPPTVSSLGLLPACRLAGIDSIQILTSMSHSSLSKAASIVGLARASVREVGREGEPWRLDLERVEKELARGEGNRTASIIVVSAGEVNTGRFATSVLDMPKLRSLADRWGAWIHVDGGKFTEYLGGLVTWCIDGCLAFGIFARALPKTDEFLSLHANVAGLELADSIAADGHKLLNVVCYPLSCHHPICTVHATNTPLSPTTTASSSAATPPSSPRSAPTPTPPTSPPHLLLLPPETPSSPHSTSALKTRAASAPCPSTPCS